MKYGNNPGNELIHGCKYGTLTVKDAKCLVDILQRSLQVSENNDSKLNCLQKKFQFVFLFLACTPESFD